MILIDTSVWVAHFRHGTPMLQDLLDAGLVFTYPFVIGELACGNLKDRTNILGDLEALPSAASATHEEVLRLVADRQLWGRGIGWVDAHLLASALLSGCPLWTLDARLVRAASHAGVRPYQHP
jgi:hypothetical protein